MEDVQDCSAPVQARVLEGASLVPCCYASLHSELTWQGTELPLLRPSCDVILPKKEEESL